MRSVASSVTEQRVRSVVGRGAVAATSAVAWTVWRDLRRARATAHLDPPAAAIDLEVHPATAAPGAPLRLAALGDSSIVGIGADRVQDCLAVQLGRRVADASGRSVHVRGHGVSGARTADVTATQLAALTPGRPPDVVLVVVGANDIMHVTPPWRYRRAVAHLYTRLRERLGAPVIVCSLPEVRAITVVGRPLRGVAIMYGRVLGAIQRLTVRRLPGVTFVDARRLAGPSFLRHPDTMSGDGFHPSAMGYGLLADALAPAVTAALSVEAPARSPAKRVE